MHYTFHMKFKFSSLRPLDFVFFCLLVAAGIFLTVSSLSKNGAKVRVLANGGLYEYSAETDGTYSVEGVLGETTFEIKGGKVHIIDSPCKNKICVNQGWSSPLVCLPNNVTITLEDSGNGDYDAISQ